MQHPRQDRTPTSEGQHLPRPDEELVDQGPGFDVGTLLTRGRLLTVLGLANGGVPLEGVAVYVWHCTREGGYSS